MRKPKKLFYRLLYWMWWCWQWTKVGLYRAFSLTPWGTARIVYALQKYVESDWYKERRQAFCKRKVLDMYYDHNEDWFFKRRFTRREKWGVAFMPFHYIRSAQEVLHESGLLDYI